MAPFRLIQVVLSTAMRVLLAWADYSIFTVVLQYLIVSRQAIVGALSHSQL